MYMCICESNKDQQPKKWKNHCRAAAATPDNQQTANRKEVIFRTLFIMKCTASPRIFHTYLRVIHSRVQGCMATFVCPQTYIGIKCLNSFTFSYSCSCCCSCSFTYNSWRVKQFYGLMKICVTRSK